MLNGVIEKKDWKGEGGLEREGRLGKDEILHGTVNILLWGYLFVQSRWSCWLRSFKLCLARRLVVEVVAL